MISVRKLDAAICDFLLSKGANIEYQSNFMTPMLLLSSLEILSFEYEKSVKCAQVLISFGANVNVADKFLTSPLLYAVSNKNCKLTELLIEKEANIDHIDNRGSNALHYACYHGSYEIATKLIEAGCNYKLINNSGCTPIDVAYAQGFSDLGTFMDSGCKGIVPKRSKRGEVLRSSTQLKQFSDLELFLAGLDLLDLLPMLQDENCITFKQLLTLTDSELEKIGITQLGIRKKILNGVNEVNKKDWKTESFPHTREFSRYLSCSEANAMIKNICSQTQYMTSSVAYFRKQIANDPTNFMSSARNDNTLTTVIQSVSLTVDQLREIYHQIDLLNSNLVGLMENFPDNEKRSLIDQIPDLETKVTERSFFKKFLFTGSVFCIAFTCGYVLTSKAKFLNWTQLNLTK